MTTTNTKTRILRPHVDIIEQAETILLYADMPGVGADNIDLTLEKNVLTVHGKAEARHTTYQRAFTLSKKIDRDNIGAVIADGVLTVTLPKVEAIVPEARRIAVKTAALAA